MDCGRRRSGRRTGPAGHCPIHCAGHHWSDRQTRLGGHRSIRYCRSGRHTGPGGRRTGRRPIRHADRRQSGHRAVRRIRRGSTRPGPRRCGARRHTGHCLIHNPGHGRTRRGCPGCLSLAHRPGCHRPVGPTRRRVPRRLLAVLSPPDADHGMPSIRCPAHRGCRRPSRRRTCLAVRSAPDGRHCRGSSGRHRTRLSRDHYCRPSRHSHPNCPSRGSHRHPSRRNRPNGPLLGSHRRPNCHNH
jgi:hypothetical protein